MCRIFINKNIKLDELDKIKDLLNNIDINLGEENKKLEDKNRDLQRDVAHLTKKVDKNRTEIKSLREEIESGVTNETDKKYTEIARIYESAIDKAEDLIYRLQTELSLAHSKVEDVGENEE